MPLSRYQIRNEYSLSDPELYKIADKDDPEALLEGVAMAGLVGVLRQLGDLAEFAAEIFHNLHEEVMATAARDHGLIVRVQQLEAELPTVEKTLLLQTSHTSFLYNLGSDWHPNLRMNQNLVTQGNLPRFVLDSYEESRGPPRLFLLDKFDVAGAGACLKRYTDPSFFKEVSSSNGRNLEGQREKRIRKAKKRGPHLRNGETPETYPSSHAKLHQLFLEENIESGSNYPERRVKLKNRLLIGSLSGNDKGNKKNSYMEKFVDTDSLQQSTVDDKCVDSLSLTWTYENGYGSCRDIIEVDTVSPVKESISLRDTTNDFDEGKLKGTIASEAGAAEYNHGSNAGKISSAIPKIVDDEQYADSESQLEIGIDHSQNSYGLTCEIDNYLDACATIESEVETDSEYKKIPYYSSVKPAVVDSNTSVGRKELHTSGSQSVGNFITSEEDTNFFEGRDSSSCSVSVDTFAENTPELDHCSMLEEIPGNEPEKHIVRSTNSTVRSEIPDLSDTLDSLVRLPLNESVRSDSVASSIENHSNDDVSRNANVSSDLRLTFTGTNICIKNPVVVGSNDSASSSIHDLNSQKQSSENSGHAFPSDFVAGALSRSLDDPVIKEVIADIQNEKEASSSSIGDQTDILPSISCSPQSCASYSFSETVNTDETNIAGVTSPRNESNCELSAGEMRGNSVITGNLSAAVNHVSTPIYSEPLVIGKELDESTTEIQVDTTSDHGHDDNLVDKDAVAHDSVLIDLISELASNPTHVLRAEYNTEVCDDVMKVEVLETGADRSGQVDENHHHDNDMLVPSSSSQYPEKVEERSVSFNEKCQQNEEEASPEQATELAEQKHVDSIQNSSQNLASHVCDRSSDWITGSLAEDAQNSGNSDAIEEPSTCGNNAQDTYLLDRKEGSADSITGKHLEPINSTMMGLDLPVHHRALPVLGMLPDEPQIILDAPPLPPLPPMQWRLSRFQNSSTPDRQMVQHTLGSVPQVPAPVLEISSEDKKHGVREDNLSSTALSGSVMPQNGIQISTNGYLPQEGQPLSLPMLQNTSAASKRLVLEVHNNMNEIRKEDTFSFTTPTSLTSDSGTQDRTNGHVGCSDNNVDGTRREDDPLPTSAPTIYQNGSQTSEESNQPRGNLNEFGSWAEDHSSEYSPVRSGAEVVLEIGAQDEHLKQDTEEIVNSDDQFLPPEVQPQQGLVAPEVGSTWSSDGIQSNANENTSETLQKKPPRPRNPLIDEVVAIDKSKLRKVERVKSVELKPGDSLFEQLQLKKVERVKPSVEEAEDGESLMEHVQLRKAAEKVARDLEQKTEETESPRMQLRKVSKRANSMVGSKTVDRDSLLEQIRTKSFNLKPAILARSNIQGPSIQGPRTNLKVAAIIEKASNIRQAMAGSDEEDDADTWSDC